MRAPRSLVRGRFAAPALAALVLLAACNALNGSGDLSVGACEGCDGVDGSSVDGTSVLPDGASPPAPDAALDAPGADAAKEGPGGTLDPTFGAGGMVVLDPLLVDPRAVAVRTDGRILVVGSAGNDLAAAAFTPAGAVDLTFGTAGRIIKGSGDASYGSAVAFDSKGRAVVGGTAVVVTTVATRFAYAVRIGASAVDTTFATAGSIRVATGGQEARGVVVTAGDSSVYAISNGDDHRFLRLDATGVPDATFGSSGTASVGNVGGEPVGLVALPDGFASVGTGDNPAGKALAAVKISLAGQPVATFGLLARATSKVGPDNNELGRSIAAQADGKVVVAGDYDPNLNLAKRVTAVIRFTATGQVDSGYGAAGKVVVDLTEPLVARETETTSTNVVLDGKGRALVVGSVHDKGLAAGVGDRFRAWVGRLGTDGKLDPLFGAQGKLVFGAAPARLVVHGAALQPDGKLVVVGVDTNGNKLFLARIITSTTL